MITLEQLQAGIVLPIDKPRQWTSFQAVNKIKAVVRNSYGLKKFKIGHAGTLDPLATGLLLVCLGKATKSIPLLQDGDKIYTGTMVFGATTPCYDMERAIDRHYPFEHITAELVEQHSRRFVGNIMQTPPMFSAVKIDGKRAYELAREELEDIRKPCAKPVTIQCFEITDFTRSFVPPQTDITDALPVPGKHLYDHPQCVIPEGLPAIDFRIHCGKGTYIRSLARDLGESLGSGAFLASLRREQIGEDTVGEALKIDEIERYLCGENVKNESLKCFFVNK